MDDILNKLKAIAIKKKIVEIGENGPRYSIQFYSGGNIDDAYQLGYGDGEISMAREILSWLENNK